jgi:hypothetical protein
MVSSYPMISPRVPFIHKTPYNYPMGLHGHSFVTRNGQKLLNIMFLAIFILSITLCHGPMNGFQVSLIITQGAPYTHKPK